LIDLHCDTISKLFEQGEEVGLRKNSFHVDLNKLMKAGSLAQFFALCTGMTEMEQKNDLEYCLALIDRFHEEISVNQDYIAVARNDKEVEENVQKGKISAFLSLEGGEVLQGKLYNLRNFYRLGVRLITLTWNKPNALGYPNCKEEYRKQGITNFGKEVIKEMNKLGMLIDVSHLSDQGFYDVAQYSSKPFIASHSNARILKDHPRNLTDDMIRVIAEREGVIGINFYSQFLGESLVSRIEDIIRHIVHIQKVGGTDVIALGTDFDGINCMLEIKDMSEMNRLIDALKENGFSSNAIEKITFQNARRVIKEVLQ
jgi:membrane dipeptidase